MSDENTKDLTCENSDRPERTGATATRSKVKGASIRPHESMKDDDSHPNESDASLDNITIEISDVDDPVDEEQIEAIEARIAVIEKIDFSETIPPQRELLKFEKETLQAALEALQEPLETNSIEGGDRDE